MPKWNSLLGNGSVTQGGRGTRHGQRSELVGGKGQIRHESHGALRRRHWPQLVFGSTGLRVQL
jgi:hypothetical protein